MLYATLTNVSPWSSPTLALIDSILLEHQVSMFDMPWSSYTYEADGEHFTPESLDVFVVDLAKRLASLGVRGSLLVVTDSTIDHFGEYGSRRLVGELNEYGVRASVRAECGAGYYARGVNYSTAVTLLEEARDGRRWDNVVFMMGWNDSCGHSRRLGITTDRVLRAAISRACSRAHSLTVG